MDIFKRSPRMSVHLGVQIPLGILAALLNGVILLVATGAIAWEAIQRFFEPGQVAGIQVAKPGLCCNNSPNDEISDA